MASKGSASNVTRACLRPSYAKDGHGLYVSVVCGKISGQLYPDRMSKKSQVNASWFVGNGIATPSEVECLGGEKSSRKWKQSILHMLSVSPSPASIASLSSSSTIIQGSESNYDGLNVAHLIAIMVNCLLQISLIPLICVLFKSIGCFLNDVCEISPDFL